MSDMLDNMLLLMEELGSLSKRSYDPYGWLYKPTPPPLIDPEPFRVFSPSLSYTARPLIEYDRSVARLYNVAVSDPDPFAIYGGIKVYELSDALIPTVTRQRRTHRKTRINKKWRKRYGFVTEWDKKALNTYTVIGEGADMAIYAYHCQIPALRKALEATDK